MNRADRTQSAERVASHYLKQAGAHQIGDYIAIPDVKKAFAKFKTKAKGALPPNTSYTVHSGNPMSKNEASGAAAREGYKNITRSYISAFPVGQGNTIVGWYFYANHFFKTTAA